MPRREARSWRRCFRPCQAWQDRKRFPRPRCCGLRNGEVRFGSDDHAERLHIGDDGLDLSAAGLKNNFAEVHGAAPGETGPENVGQIFEANLVASSRPRNLASISIAIALLCTRASPLAPDINSVP